MDQTERGRRSRRVTIRGDSAVDDTEYAGRAGGGAPPSPGSSTDEAKWAGFRAAASVTASALPRGNPHVSHPSGGK